MSTSEKTCVVCGEG